MNLVRFKPAATTWPTFDRIFDDFFKDIGTTVGRDNFVNSKPAVNIVENKDGFALEVAAPGLTKDDFNVSVEKNTLTISASKENKQEEDGKYRRREFSYFTFKRSFHLPNTIDANNITAKYENGVLSLQLAKKEEAKEKPARTIEIG
ncbi:MAG: Hsp20/alpha crystallin family protein [Saprospiraceae bacterium]|nr:Hsp20/alpha crystallin family protein [Saprospiraceae bacterium]